MIKEIICHKVTILLVSRWAKSVILFPVKIFRKNSKNLQEESVPYEFKLDQYNINESINAESANESINDLAEAGIYF